MRASDNAAKSGVSPGLQLPSRTRPGAGPSQECAKDSANERPGCITETGEEEIAVVELWAELENSDVGCIQYRL